MSTLKWKQLFKENIIRSAEDYITSDAIHNLEHTQEQITAVVSGIEDFSVEICISDTEIKEMKCTCSYAKTGGCCKHMAAVLLAWERECENSDNRNSAGLQLSCDIDDALTYAAVHNGSDFIRDIVLTNISDQDLNYIKVKICADNALVEDYEVIIEKIRPGEEKHLRDIKISVNTEYLVSLTERSFSRLTVAAYQEGVQLISQTVTVTVLAFDEWPGLQYTPELLAAFAMPNHPVIASLLLSSAKYLEKWTGDPSLAGYQFGEANRVKNMAAAAYAAIQEKNIVYAEPPSSFEECGQRIRLADAVLEQHMGTCMDMTILYVACLEAMGLNPIMVMKKGHIFAGVWLLEQTFPDMITDDPSQLEKRMSRGIHEMLVVECTAMCAGKNRSFDEAMTLAQYAVSDYENFIFAIDVKRARSMGIRPLPVRIKTDSGFEVQHEERRESDVTGAPKAYEASFDAPDSFEKEKMTKLMQWERKLLDLSLRNMLINMRMTKSVVPLLASDVSILEDALSDGEEFLVMPRPLEMSFPDTNGIPAEALAQLGSFADFIAMESKHRRLHSLYTEKELNSSLTKIYRAAKSSLEENGASTLYLALGLLRWFEGKKSETGTARYAPVILIPIDIIRKSASKGYAMRMRDEDAQMNITLLEFLKQAYGLQIAGLNPLPVDEHGVDLPKIFALVRHAVMNFPMWDVVEAGFIGNFSFTQFVMWKDIHGNGAFLEKNKIVRSLMYGAEEWDCSFVKNVDSDEAYLPVTVDASQLRAINMAAAGDSFVLHGPPGTGKSQTITAMIANALTKGKTVLFVAEKMAALEVVQKRLSVLGIQDFCLELHSNKATKKAVLDQLRRGLEIGVWGFETDYDKKIQDIRQIRSELDAYVEALHKKRPFGKSLRQLMDLYETFPDTDLNISFDHVWAGTLTDSELEHQVYSLKKLVAAGSEIGHPKGHPLAAIGQMEYSQRLKFELKDVVCSYIEVLEQLKEKVRIFTEQTGWNTPETAEEWQKVYDFAEGILSLKTIPGFLRQCNDLNAEFRKPISYLEEKSKFEEKYKSFLERWNANFLQMDMGDFRKKYEQANKKFFGKGRALSALNSELQAYASFTIEADRIPVYLTDIEFLQKEKKNVQDAKNALSEDWRYIIEQCDSLAEFQEYKQKVSSKIQASGCWQLEIEALEDAGKLADCMRNADVLLNDVKNLRDKEIKVNELLDLKFEDDPEKGWLDTRLQLCKGILENSSSVKDWIVYQQFAAECREKGLGAVCDAYESGLSADEVISVYLRSVYRTIILTVIENEPVLNVFTGTSFNEKIEQFKKMDQEFQQLTKDEMYYRLTHRLPTSYESVEVSRELNILRKAISSNGRGMSVRNLFEQIPHILPRLCPCMLMSPISVAQYLKPENDLFDIVVFDEASQLSTCKAIGVLARGKDAVIVGDPNQMPPTSFFAGNTVDEDNLDIEDLDSILDDCLALGMPSAHLQWHYRSRHESLIAFSNREFYENSMLTFPSVNDREKRVSLVRTEGFFDRGKGRINEGEAKAIVAEIRRRYEDPILKQQTIGVVTFNISQQALIEDLLQEEYQKDAAFDAWANVGEEPMFVKNLENVQGDERDVILFSIAFGPDAEGKISMNFGPLNKAGGWKRLNVAVSRAKLEMKVFTTMTSDMINLKRTKSKGVEALKDFLEFAEKGRLQGESGRTRIQKDQGITDHICKAVSDAGYSCQRDVGHSEFKVDIAVVNPYFPEEYLLGIMLDGESYRRSSNTKDREVAQSNVLNSLGWKLHRIWTMDWWDNRDKELLKLLQILDERKEIAKQIWVEQKEYDAGKEGTAGVGIEKEAETDSGNLIRTDLAEAENVQIDKKDQDSLITAQDDKTVKVSSQINDSRNNAVSMEIFDSLSLGKVASANQNENISEVLAEISPNNSANLKEYQPMEYRIEEYHFAELNAIDISTSEYVKKENQALIAEKMQQILEAEAPIAYDRLVKKTLRAFCIARSSQQTLEASDKAFKKIEVKMNKQSGTCFCWRKDQDPEQFFTYRSDLGCDDRRSVDEICLQELKNAVCLVLAENDSMEKNELVKAVIRRLGYSRSSTALIAAAERGIKYGQKTGEIIQDEEKRLLLR